MKSEKFRDLELLQELTKNPSVTQRDVGKRMGLALGLVNLRLHRLANQGFIEIVDLEKKRTCYRLTPEGIQERDRLAADHLDHSMLTYRNARRFLTESTDVVILCGGRGTRLKLLTDATPKPLLLVGGEPFLLRLLFRLRREGFRRFILTAHYLPRQFEMFLEENRSRLKGVQLLIEPEPLGTGGALHHAIGQVGSPHFLALNGDSWVDQALAPVVAEHLRAGWQATVLAVRAEHVEGKALRKGLLQLGEGREVLGFDTPESAEDGWVNGGCYVFERSAVASWPPGSYGLEPHWTKLLAEKRVGAYCSEGRLLDIGTPEIYGRAAEVLESYECEESSLR